MTVNRYIFVFAGMFIMLSLALGIEGSPLFVSQSRMCQLSSTRRALWPNSKPDTHRPMC